MSNFCTKCGTMLEEDSVFCGKCGAPCNKAPTSTVATANRLHVEAESTIVSSISIKRNRLVGIVVIAIVAIIITVLALNIFSNNYRFTIDKMCQSMESRDYDKLISCFPPSVQDTLEKYRLDAGLTKRSFLEQSMGDNKVKLSCKILSEDRLSKAGIRTLFSSLDFYQDMETAYELDLKFTITINGDESSRNSTMYVGKIDGKWYIIDNAMNSYNLLGSIM